MSRFAFALALLIAALACAPAASAQNDFPPTGPNTNPDMEPENSRFRTVPDTPGAYEFAYWARLGRTYFLERSTDLATWEYFPVIETGRDAAISYGFFTDSPRVFVRLRHVAGTYDDPYALDLDSDGLSNQEEFFHHSSPFLVDTDGDGIDDKIELGLLVLRPDDEWGWEYLQPNKTDSDGNGIPDQLEDYDRDGLTIAQELSRGTDPNKTDTDTDGVSDGKEVGLGTDPLQNDHFADHDSDDDGLNDLEEIIHGTVCLNPDTNGNDMLDGQEFDAGGDPAEPGPPPPLPDPDRPISHGPPIPDPPAPPTPPNPPAFAPAGHRVLIREASAELPKYGFDTYQVLSPPKRYLVETLTQHFSGGCPESGPIETSGTKVTEIDPDDGSSAVSGDTYVTGGGDVRSPTVRRGVVDLDGYDDPPNDYADCPGPLAVSSKLANENTTQDLKDRTKDKLPDYPDDPDDGFGDGTPHAYRILWADELGYSYQRMQVKFAWPPGTPEGARHPLTYLVVFEPFDDPATPDIDEGAHPEIVATWTWNGEAEKSDIYELDPDVLDSTKRSGRFSISPLRLYADSGSVHLGFDPPNPAEGDSPSEYWASVVQGASNTILNLDISSAAASVLEWKLTSADEERVHIEKTLSGPAKLTLTGKNTGATLPETATLQLAPKNGAGSSYLTLNVMVLPQRELKLAIYTIEDPDSPLTQFASAPAVAVPSDDEILSVCNDSFKQAGIRFVLHPERGDRARPFRYDTWGLAEFLGVHRYDGLLPARSPDGVLTEDEKSGLVGTHADAPAPALGALLPSAVAASDTIPILLFKDSGLPYDTNNLSGPKRRGLSGNGRVFLFLRNLEPHAAVAAAHEVGHMLDAHDSDDGHDNPTVTPPFPFAVMNEFPYGISPAPPSDTRYPASPRPNVALMQGGWPTGEGLPWPYGRWMRNEDWRRANLMAGGFLNE